SRTAVCLGVFVDDGERVAGTNPVGRVAEFTCDHHHSGKLGRRVPGEPDLRQVDVFAAALESAARVGDVHRHQLARIRVGVAQAGQILGVDLVGEGTRSQVA